MNLRAATPARRELRRLISHLCLFTENQPKRRGSDRTPAKAENGGRGMDSLVQDFDWLPISIEPDRLIRGTIDHKPNSFAERDDPLRKAIEHPPHKTHRPLSRVKVDAKESRRVRRALAALFGGAVRKDAVSRVWRKVKSDWDAWNARSLKDEPIIRLILDGTIVRVRLDKKATSISLLVALGVRQDGQKILLDGESEAAWRALLDDLVNRSLKVPVLVIVDGAPGLEKALAALWSDMPVQRCTVP